MVAEPFFGSVDPNCADPFDVQASPMAARFCILHLPSTAPRGLVLHLHPFAEEMNKSRRMAALQARQLAASGLAVLQFDLLGCGDSAGEFGDATWDRWVADTLWAIDLLRGRAAALAGTPLWLWGHRVGALLAAQAAGVLAEAGETASLLLWNPTTKGASALQQFLRLKAAAQALDGGGRGLIESLNRELSAGRSVQVAGYTLHQDLAAGLERAELTPPPRHAASREAVWLEVGSPSDPRLLPASQATIERWRAAGWTVHASAIAGPAFWQTAEIEHAPALIESTVQALKA